MESREKEKTYILPPAQPTAKKTMILKEANTDWS